MAYSPRNQSLSHRHHPGKDTKSDTTTLGTFTLTIELGNATMSGPDDLADALRAIADKVEALAAYPQTIRDINGNTVGEWTVTP